MSDPRPRVSDLTPEELELLALEHVESMFIELRATSAAAREQCHPVKLIKAHPFIAAGIAAAAFMLARQLSPKPAGSSGKKAAAAAPGLFDSLLSGVAGAAGNALPELVASWLAQGNKLA
ncbi:MAG: hypothetical protein ABSA67_02410 [Candidatus Brocadiia bacterium]|jgi:hypothetical protein